MFKKRASGWGVSHLALPLKAHFGLVRQRPVRRHDPKLGELVLEDSSGDGRLHDIRPIQAVDAVDTEDTLLGADHPMAVQPTVAHRAHLKQTA